MNVLLINPPNDQLLIGNNPKFLDQLRGCNPPLGLLYLAGAVEREGKHQLSVIDALAEEMVYSDIRKSIRTLQPDVVGITVLSFTLLDVMEVVRAVKEINPKIVTVLGGPHVYLYPEETIELEGVDYLIKGEGEVSFLQLLEALEEKGEASSNPGLVYKDRGNLVNNRPVPIEALDQIAHPARELSPYGKYSSLLFARSPVTTMFTSRGCPYPCTFCDRPHLGKKFRAHSADFVLKEIQHCLHLGINDIIIYDDTFTIQRDRVVAICQGIIKNGWDIAWDVRTRVDAVDEELLGLMRQAGCRRIYFGIESGVEKVMKALQKEISLDQAAKVFELTAKVGIKTLAYFMIGCPGETRADIKETFRVAKQLCPDFVHLTIFTPFPGTKIYSDGLESGSIAEDVWREFAQNPTPGFIPPHWGQYHSRRELEEMLVEGYKDFYGRSSYIVKQLTEVRSFNDLLRKTRAGLKVLFS